MRNARVRAVNYGNEALSTITTQNGVLRRLGVSGRDVADTRAQIAKIVGNRIGKDAARLFAVPSDRRPDGSIEWVDTEGASLKPVNSLPDEEAASIVKKHQSLIERIGGLADGMESEGDAGRVAAQILRLAMVTPDGYGALHAADGEPVLVNWGYAAEGQIVPGDVIDEGLPESEVGPDGAVAGAAAGAALAAGGTASASTFSDGDDPSMVASGTTETVNPYAIEEPRRRGAGWLLWLIPLVLLIALMWVIWLLLQPLDPIVREVELPPDAIEDPVPDAQARLDALRQQLADAEALRDGLVGICEVVPEQEPPRLNERAALEPEPIEPPQPLPEPEPPVVAPEPVPEVAPEPEPLPEPEPEPRVVLPTPERLELPPEVPRAEEMPRRLAQLPPEDEPQPTLCEPGWTPTQRPEVMVVVDGSGSMRDGFPGASSRIDAAKRSIDEVVRNLHKDIRTGLVSFTDCGVTTTPKKYRFNERGELLGRVRSVTPTRGTSLANSIRRAGNAAKSVGPATVVVVSDGEDTCGGDPCAVARQLKRSKPLLTINVIDLSGGRSSVLQCVAGATGGRVFTPRNANQMTEEMQEATGQPDASQCNP